MRYAGLLLLMILSIRGMAQSPIGTNNSAGADSAQSACVQNASRLLEEAFTLMQKNYYRKQYVNWDTLRAAAREKLASLKCEDAYEAINWCFREIKEKHSFIMPTLRAFEYRNETTLLKEKLPLSSMMGKIGTNILPDSIGYISIPWINTSDEKIGSLIADSIQNLIARMDDIGITRWIVDVRNNKGGNCWPMLAGLGPILGEGVCGFFVRNQEKVPFSYQQGAAWQGKTERCRSSVQYQLKKKPVRIAVLMNNNTASSGEIVALAFKGLEHVKFIGESSAGYTTANATYTLSDQSMLVLTICQEADRNGKIHAGRLYPDIVSYGTTEDDAPLFTAIRWLNQLSL